jgi:hypothetical protein
VNVRNGKVKVEKGTVSNAMKRTRGEIIFDLLSEHIDVTIARRWFAELSTVKEQFLTWMVPMMYYLYGGPSLHGVGRSGESEVDMTSVWTRNVAGEKIDIDEEFVFDMHTKEGKKAGSGSRYFREESSRVLNECIGHWPRDLKNFYLAWRARCPPTLEGSEYEFVGDWQPPGAQKMPRLAGNQAAVVDDEDDDEDREEDEIENEDREVEENSVGEEKKGDVNVIEEREVDHDEGKRKRTRSSYKVVGVTAAMDGNEGRGKTKRARPSVNGNKK